MFAVEGIFDGKSVQLDTAELPVRERYRVVVTFLDPAGQKEAAEYRDEKYGDDWEREPIIIPPETHGKITDEMLGKPFIHTNGWKFNRDEANER